MGSSATPKRDPRTRTWWFVVELPPGSDGRRRQAKRRGFKTKADAQAALDDLRVAGRQGAYVPPARQRLGEFLTDDWLPAIKVTIEESTWASYERYLRLHVIPHLGGVRLEALDAGMLNRLTLAGRGRCAGCAQLRRLVSPPGAGATHCCDCAGLPAAHACSICGREDKLYERGYCARCALARRTAELMAGPDGTVPAALVPVHDAIVASASPYKALNWLRAGAGAPILADLAARRLALSHDALDAHPQTAAAGYVRHMLVAHGALPERDEALARLERWIGATVAGIGRVEDRQLVRAFATWHTLRGVRRRAARTSPTRRTATRYARNQVAAAIALLEWFAYQHLTLAACSQSDIDRWLTSGPASRRDARHFLGWTTQRGLTTELVVPVVSQHEGNALDAEHRWTIARRLLHDTGLKLIDRVSGSFVLLYAQPLSRIAVMTTDQVGIHGHNVTVRFARHDVEVPEPLAGLVTTLAATGRQEHVGIAAPSGTPWLFPGHLPGRPITASRLGARLSPVGIDARAARRAALIQLAAQLPAPVLADSLGITVTTAAHWVQTAGGDWANYAAATAGNSALPQHG